MLLCIALNGALKQDVLGARWSHWKGQKEKISKALDCNLLCGLWSHIASWVEFHWCFYWCLPVLHMNTFAHCLIWELRSCWYLPPPKHYIDQLKLVNILMCLSEIFRNRNVFLFFNACVFVYVSVCLRKEMLLRLHVVANVCWLNWVSWKIKSLYLQGWQRVHETAHFQSSENQPELYKSSLR